MAAPLGRRAIEAPELPAPGPLLELGGMTARVAESEADLAAALALRARVFRPWHNGGAEPDADRDGFDARCVHVLLERDGQLLGTFRTAVFHGPEIARSYSAQSYGLAPLQNLGCAMLELGRFCLRPDMRQPDLLRLAWAALTLLAARERAGLLFGCASFKGVDPDLHRDSLAVLARRHLGPRDLRPTRITEGAVDLPVGGVGAPTDMQAVDLKAGLRNLPSLLRSYLGLGGWVSDHAVIDRDLGTVHVFTAVEIARIPAPRARALRAMAGI